MLRYRLALLLWRLTHPRQAFAELVIRLVPLRARTRALRKLRPQAPVSPEPSSFRELPKIAPDISETPHPDVSVVIPTHSRHDLLEICLASLALADGRERLEIIVVDNASNRAEDVAGIARRFGATLARSGHNAGFAAAINLGVKRVSAQTVVFLNDDTVVSKKWLEPLISPLSDPQIGIAQPLTNSCGNEGRVRPAYADYEELNRFAESLSNRHGSSVFSLPRAGFFCVAMRRNTVNEVGPLDERFGVGFFEDDDYSRRVRRGGYEIVCASGSFVHHWGSGTFAELGEEATSAQYERNRQLYREKWR